MDEKAKPYFPHPPLLGNPGNRDLDAMAEANKNQAEIQRLGSSMPVAPGATPMEMLARAVQMSASPETLERLLSLQERFQANLNRMAFDGAMALAAAEMPQVVKNRAVSHGTGKAAYRYADLAAVEEAVRPVLSKHGLHYRWRPDATDPARLIVTCVISGHGHHEEFSLAGPPDQSGAKNPIQAIGSTVTYLQRYTLMAALGLAAALDDDAQSAGSVPDKLSANELEVIKQMLNDAGAESSDIERFCIKMKVAGLEFLRRDQLREAKDSIEYFKQGKAERAAKKP